MRKVSGFALGAMAAVAMSLLASAAPGGNGRPAVPPGAVQVAEDVYYLGKHTFDGVELDGYAFVDRAKAHAKAAGGKRAKQCYKLIGFPAWAAPEPWSTGTGNAGIPMQARLASGMAAWENASGADIFGDFTGDPDYHFSATPDGKNGAEFGDAGGGGSVAVTYVWGSRRDAIFEWDTVFGSNWQWADGASATAFDFLNVATHELGHAAGLAHPGNSCTEETMYAYVEFGETKKRDLNAGDIAGINALY